MMTAGIALNSNYEANSVQSLCFSFNIRDLNLLLTYYGASFFLYRELIRRDYIECFLIGLSVLLMLLFVLSVQGMIKKIRDESENNIGKEGILIAKKIRNEYQKICKKNRKEELFKKTNNNNEPITNSRPSTSTCNTVHFNYLNRHDTTRSHFKNL